MSMSGEAMGSTSASTTALGVEVRQRFPQSFGPQRTGAAHSGLEHLARHFAGAESGHADL